MSKTKIVITITLIVASCVGSFIYGMQTVIPSKTTIYDALPSSDTSTEKSAIDMVLESMENPSVNSVVNEDGEIELQFDEFLNSDFIFVEKPPVD